MKIVKGKAKFEPVTLTLESQEELNIFTEVFYRVGGQGMVDVFGQAGYVYGLLSGAGGVSTDDDQTCGSIDVV